jgi:anthranilate phosphoribosyltransferase
VGACIDRVGIGFLFAPVFHQAMRHAIGPRREIGLRTIFNLLGPLTNPAGATAQVIGIYREDLTEPIAEVLQRLGCRSAFVVHGEGGYDEMSITGPTRLTRLAGDEITTTTLYPEDVSLTRASHEEIRGGDADRNAAITMEVMRGEPGAPRDMVLLNAAAALVAADRASDLREGVSIAAEAIDSGAAMERFRALVDVGKEMTAHNEVQGD